MKFEINNERFDPLSVTYRERGYGKDPGKKLVHFSLDISDKNLSEYFSISFDEYVSQCKYDDLKFNDVDVPEIKDSGYPNLNYVLKNDRKLFIYLLLNWVYFQFLQSVFGRNDPSNIKFVVNKISDVVERTDGFLVCGEGFHI